MTNNIRRPLFDGMREIGAIWFDLPLIGETEARRRILAHWQRGASVHRAGGGYLLTLARPRFADCAALDGLALCRAGQLLSSAPLAADEQAALAPGACLLVRGAHILACTLGEAERVDPAAWIDTSAIVIRQPLKVPESKVQVSLGTPEESKSLREILDNVIAPPSARQAKFLRESEAGKPAREPGLAGAAAAAVAGAGLAAAAGAGMLVRMLTKLLGGARAGTPGAAGGGRGAADGEGRAGPDPKWKRALMNSLARLANATQLSKVLGWRQAAYLQKMVEMFERGDVQEALRHAIPLGGDAELQRQMLGMPTRRSSLDISAPGGTTPAIHLDVKVQEFLRQKYRALFARLEREGRIDEATFVLAELLKSPLEAVDYLERNQRFKQAAQLAEKLQLAPEVALRLWFLAGDAERAIRIARLSGAFADAVRKLELAQHSGASALRMEWAVYLAARGDLAEAADAIWPLGAQRGQALAWLLEAERHGGTPGARALVRKLALMPEALAESVAQIESMLDAAGADGAQVRTTLGVELSRLEVHSAATRRLAAELLRPLLADRSAGHNLMERPAFTKLMQLADAGVFESDLPAIPFAATPAATALRSADTPLQVHGGEAGLLAIHDARRLPGGHYLLALGEGGLLRVTAAGKHVVHFPVPAYHLVLSANGLRALALARRGDVVRAARIDLGNCKVSDWIAHPIDAWAAQYDGVIWNAVIDNRIVAIDTTQDRLAVVWQVADLPGKVIDFHDNGNSQTILIAAGDTLEQWRYMLPARRMSQRDSFPLPAREFAKALAHPLHTVPLLLQVSASQAGVSLQAPRPGGQALSIGLGAHADALRADIGDGRLLVQSVTEAGEFRCVVADRNLHAVMADLRLPHAATARVAACGDHLLLFDLAGRLADVDLATGVICSLTLS